MKKWLIFLLGFITGTVFTIAIAIIAVVGSSESPKGATFFEEPGECFSSSRFEVMQAIGDNYALAFEQCYNWDFGYTNTNLLVLLTNDNGKCYYDQQIVEVPKDKCVRQIGVYKYQTKSEIWKTVPIVKLMDK